MITVIFGGVAGGKRGILSTKGGLSLPLRLVFYANRKYSNTYPPEIPQHLLKSSSYIHRIVKPFQDITIS